MKICIDDKIPYIKGVLEPYAQVEYLPGGLASPGKLRHADALIIRTRTLCNEAMLRDSAVRFIATATIGYDHIDTDYCRQHGIVWTNAPGCNADSVSMYVCTALQTLAQQKHFCLADKVIGVVGLGHVGSKVAHALEKLGCRVLRNDPPKARAMKLGNNSLVSLEQVLQEADIITLHPLLSRQGQDATFHLFDEKRLQQLQSHQILVNASRGEVVDNAALKSILQQGRLQACVLDVWENEPHIDPELLALVDIATPHIAGYAIDGKANGTTMSVRALARHFHLSELYDWQVTDLPSSTPSYDIMLDDKHLRAHPELFEELRTLSHITHVLSTKQ